MQKFDENPILNSPYCAPKRHWHLNDDGGPTGEIGTGRRPSVHFVPIPMPLREQERLSRLGSDANARRPRARKSAQGEIEYGQKLKDNPIINQIREQVNIWRISHPDKWNVTYETRKLLQHWRGEKGILRPFYCQIEATETLIWLNEVAPHTAAGRDFLDEIRKVNKEANPELLRYACKMATGAGKTMVMAMLIAYHTINKTRMKSSKRFCSNFLIITPGITIKDRLRVLLPADPNNFYKVNGILPPEFAEDIRHARIVIKNFQALGKRELTSRSKSMREVLQGNDEVASSTLEAEGQMLERACKGLLGSKDAIVINDEAHHCYRHKAVPEVLQESKRLSREEKQEANRNNEAGRIWIRGIEALNRKIGVKACYDLSATPYFLSGSGYTEGQLFPWVVSDYDLMEAIESGIVKLPRVPIDDNAVTADNLPMFRNLYKHARKDLPRKGRTAQGKLNLASQPLPAQLTAGLRALYDQYAKTHEAWRTAGIVIPPVFAIVCNNTSTSKLVHDYVAGYEHPNKHGIWRQGTFELFSNVGKDGKPLSRMRTLLIDSEQLDSGEAMSKEFKEAAATEIELYKNEMRLRFPGWDATKLSDEQLLREIMNTVGKKGRLGEQIRCVVSVSMLTEGWDTNNVTHILGVRAFGTQLLCEQVVGRGLRRYAYNLDEDGLLQPEYADVFGVPFTFASGSVVPKPLTPPHQERVWAMTDRTKLAIYFPRVRGYTVKLPDRRLIAKFDTNSRLTISPEDAPSLTKQRGIVGKGLDITFESLKQHRINELAFYLARETAQKFANADGSIPPSRFRDLVPITRKWLSECLTCLGGTMPQYLLWEMLTVKAAERIFRACIEVEIGTDTVVPLIDKFSPEGSSNSVDFQTTKKRLHETRSDKCHINLAVCDSDWEMSFCKILEETPEVHSYVRNDHLGFEVPYIYRKREHIYLPDFIVLVDEGRGPYDLLSLVVEIKGLRDDKDQVKADTMRKQWVPAVNNDGQWGRWAFEEILDIQQAREVLARYSSCRPQAASL